MKRTVLVLLGMAIVLTLGGSYVRASCCIRDLLHEKP